MPEKKTPIPAVVGVVGLAVDLSVSLPCDHAEAAERELRRLYGDRWRGRAQDCIAAGDVGPNACQRCRLVMLLDAAGVIATHYAETPEERAEVAAKLDGGPQ